MAEFQKYENKRESLRHNRFNTPILAHCDAVGGVHPIGPVYFYCARQNPRRGYLRTARRDIV